MSFFSVLKGGGLGIGLAVPAAIAGVIFIIHCIRKKKMYRECRRPHFAKDKENSDIPSHFAKDKENSDIPSPVEIVDFSTSPYSVADNDFIDETKTDKDNEETEVT